MSEWCLIESDPGVFTELLQKIGVQGIEVEEVYNIDSLEDLKPVHGLIFLFKWQPGPPRECLEFYDPELFFANQVITNACATQAIISILLNSKKVEIGPELTQLKEFSLPLGPQDRGLAIGNSQVIRDTHNSFARDQVFEFEKVKATEKDDVYHFISYIHLNGNIYELDGMQPGPIFISESTEDEWLDKVKPAIIERIQHYAENEIRFSLLAIVNSKMEIAKNTSNVIRSHITAIQTKLMSLGESVEDPMDVDVDEEYFGSLPDDIPVLVAELQAKRQILAEQEQIIDMETEKYARWRKENARRKHNYIPFILGLLERLAKKNRLIPLLDQAKKRRSEAAEKQEEAKVQQLLLK